MFVILEKWVLYDGWKGHSLFCIKNKNSFEEIFQIWSNLFELFFFLDSVRKIKLWIAIPYDFCLHIVTFEGVLCEEHEIEQNPESPDVDRNSIVLIADNLRSHVFFSTTVSFGPDSSDWSGKSKICNFIPHFRSLASLLPWQKNVFTLDVSMDKVSFMNAFESFHDLHNDFEGMFQSEGFSGEFGLVSEKISLFAVFQHHNYKIRRWI